MWQWPSSAVAYSDTHFTIAHITSYITNSRYPCRTLQILTLIYSRLPSFYRQLKSYHFAHHWNDYENGFGVTSRFWDRIFGTELVMAKPVVNAS